jgi:hypothetical protein
LIENRSGTAQRKQAANRGFMSTYIWFVLVFPDACSGSLSGERENNALHYFWEGCRHIKAETDLRRWAAVKVSVSTLIMAGPVTPRCLQISAILSILF